MSELDFSFDLVTEMLSQIAQGELEVSETALIMNIAAGEDSAQFSMTKSQLRELLKRLRDLSTHGETTLHSDRSVESFVRETAPYGPRVFWRRPSPLVLTDSASKLKYTLGQASDEYVLFLFLTLHKLGTLAAIWRRRPWQYLLRDRVAAQEDLFDGEQEVRDTPLDVLRFVGGPLLTLQIEAEQRKSIQELEALSDGFLFHFAFNTDVALVPVPSLEEVARRVQIRRMRRSRLDDLDPPRREYRRGLVKHYQLGVATESVPLEYLSYYQVAESFFEDVFNDDLRVRVETLITNPSFSYQRKRDLDRLVGLIKKRLRIRGEEMVFSEEEALRLTLERYVRLDQVVDELSQIDPALVERYRKESVSFSGAPKVDLTTDDSSKAMADLSRRLYQTRNAVVHSKEGGKPKYIPFLHDRELSQEVPLMRLVAEEILLNSSEVLS